jgi:hypothetical protein
MTFDEEHHRLGIVKLSPPAQRNSRTDGLNFQAGYTQVCAPSPRRLLVEVAPADNRMQNRGICCCRALHNARAQESVGKLWARAGGRLTGGRSPNPR